MKMNSKILKLFLLILFSFSLSFVQNSTFAQPPSDMGEINTTQNVQNEALNADENMNLVQNDVRVDDLDIEPISTKEVKKSVVPDTKKEGKKVVSLFLKSMIMVLVCALLLYFLLMFVRKNWNDAFKEEKFEEEFEVLDLAIPRTKIEALKSFLNRTR